TLRTSRGQIIRSALEGLSFQLKQALRILIEATEIDVKGIRVVGGGAKNLLWNQIRADVTGLPVTVTEQLEYTALGAALVAWTGIGRYRNLKDARKNVFERERVFKPSANQDLYENVFEHYVNALESLRGYYQR
ncbi:MAG: FGGY-family carbohydrate kinase, partial [Candidatus Bathyarchaeota archaeon]|nr:FGGY-family carbohydrate kinase [Candidatus Bathyarchaeota archaeon]